MNLWNTKRTAKTKYQRAGFTLLELLVVISIIGILTAIGMAAFSVAQKKGRDGRRVGDLKGIQSAFEQYYAANSSNYPLSGTNCPSGNLTIASGTTYRIPVDPKGSTAYPSSCTAASYCFCVLLESNSGNSNATANSTCSGMNNGSGSYFCVKNLQ